MTSARSSRRGTEPSHAVHHSIGATCASPIRGEVECPNTPNTPAHPNTPALRSLHHDRPTDRPGALGRARLHPIDWIDRDPTHQCVVAALPSCLLGCCSRAKHAHPAGRSSCVRRHTSAASSSVADRLVVSSDESMMLVLAWPAVPVLGCVDVVFDQLAIEGGGMLAGRAGRQNPRHVSGVDMSQLGDAQRASSLASPQTRAGHSSTIPMPARPDPTNQWPQWAFRAFRRPLGRFEGHQRNCRAARTPQDA